MADKIVVLDEGSVEQVGSPLELYNQPEQPVRRRLHRLADDEPDPRRKRRPSAARRRSASGPSTPTFRPPRASGRRRSGVAEHLGSDTFVHAERRRRRPVDHSRSTARRRSRRATAIFVTPREAHAASLRRRRPATAGVIAGLRKTVDIGNENHERQTLRRRAGAGCPRASPRRATTAPISARASFISASAISTARIRRSISTICSPRGAITTGRSSAPACANTTSTCAPSSPRRIG